MHSGINSASAWGTWKTSRFIYTNDGPQLCRPPSPQTMDVMPSDNGRSATVLDDYNQCMFVRYFTMHRRRLWVPKIIKAGAGPHNLGSRDRDNEGSPPGRQRDSDSNSDRGSSALDSGGENCSSASNIDSGSGSLIHNPTIVRYLLPFAPTPAHLAVPSQRDRDDFDVVADYIFQVSGKQQCQTRL